MPRIVRESTSELQIAPTRILGWSFLLFGATMAVVLLGLLRGGEPGRYVVGGGGVFFALIGLLAVLYRFELTIDLMSRSYRGRRGFWPSVTKLRGSLDELQGVVIEREWRERSSSDGDRDERYVIWKLALDFGAWKIGFYESRAEAQAHEKLEHYARLLRTRAIDRTKKKESSREGHELDLSVSERSHADGNGPEAPGAPPDGSRMLWEPVSGAGWILLPSRGMTASGVVAIVIGLPLAAVGTLFGLDLLGFLDVPMIGPGTGNWVVALFLVLIGATSVHRSLRGAYQRETIREEQDGLLFYTAWGRRRRCRRFVAKRAIEEIDLTDVADDDVRRRAHRRGRTGPPQELTVRTDGRVVRCGAGLTGQEQQWLLRAVSYLAAR